jgi:Zn-dependent metalloprotease
MDDYVRTFEDNGGVHINSGIPNRAFYLAATALGGHAWEKIGRIWHDVRSEAETQRELPELLPLTVSSAVRLYGGGSEEG